MIVQDSALEFIKAKPAALLALGPWLRTDEVVTLELINDGYNLMLTESGKLKDYTPQQLSHREKMPLWWYKHIVTDKIIKDIFWDGDLREPLESDTLREQYCEFVTRVENHPALVDEFIFMEKNGFNVLREEYDEVFLSSAEE